MTYALDKDDAKIYTFKTFELFLPCFTGA